MTTSRKRIVRSWQEYPGSCYHHDYEFLCPSCEEWVEDISNMEQDVGDGQYYPLCVRCAAKVDMTGATHHKLQCKETQVPETTEIDVQCGCVWTIAFMNNSFKPPVTYVWVCQNTAAHNKAFAHLSKLKHCEIIQSGPSRFQRD